MLQSEQQRYGLMDLKSASEFLEISPYLLRRLTRENQVPFVRLGKQYFYRRDALKSFLAAQESANFIPQVPQATVPQAASAVIPNPLPASRRGGIRQVPQNL